jgi:hypothetical protein
MTAGSTKPSSPREKPVCPIRSSRPRTCLSMCRWPNPSNCIPSAPQYCGAVQAPPVAYGGIMSRMEPRISPCPPAASAGVSGAPRKRAVASFSRPCFMRCVASRIWCYRGEFERASLRQLTNALGAAPRSAVALENRETRPYGQGGNHALKRIPADGEQRQNVRRRNQNSR